MTGSPVGESTKLIASLGQHLAAGAPREVTDPGLAQAAVAVVVARDGPAILFIRRTIRQGDPWSGQMALPGGRISASDPNLKATAIRETNEEVAIALNEHDYLGQLDDVAPRTPELPPLMVRPFVFQLSHQAAATPCSREVDSALWIPIGDLVHPGSYGAVTLRLKGSTRVFPGFRVGQDVVWGMTERIITPLLRSISLIP